MAVARFVGIVFLPILIFGLLNTLNVHGLPRWIRNEQGCFMMSPMVLLGVLEFDKHEFFRNMPAVYINVGLYLGLALFFRARALRWARLHLRKG
jgi:hypothetical protein